MRKFTVDHTLKMRIGGSLVLPKPFPGPCPVRIGWQVKWRDGRKWEYFGKPSRNSFSQFMKAARHPLTTMWFLKEIDQNTIVAETSGIGPSGERVRFVRVTHRLFSCYQPHELNTTIPGSLRMYSHKIGQRWILSSGSAMPQEYKDSYQRWLRMEGLS